MGERNVN